LANNNGNNYIFHLEIDTSKLEIQLAEMSDQVNHDIKEGYLDVESISRALSQSIHGGIECFEKRLEKLIKDHGVDTLTGTPVYKLARDIMSSIYEKMENCRPTGGVD